MNEVISIGSKLIWPVVICPNIYNIPRMQTWMKRFQFAQMVPIVPSCFNYLNMTAAVGICPNASNCMKISMKHMYIIQIEPKLFEVPQNRIKLFEVTQNWMKMFHLAQIWMESLPLGQSWFSLLEFHQISPLYYTFLTSPKFERSCPTSLKFHWDC